MSLTTASHSLPEIILWAGVIAGSIDLCAALTFAATRGTKPKSVLQTIASALIGPEAFSRSSTVPLGLGLHYLIAFTVAATYAVASGYHAHRACSVVRACIWRSRLSFYVVCRAAAEPS